MDKRRVATGVIVAWSVLCAACLVAAFVYGFIIAPWTTAAIIAVVCGFAALIWALTVLDDD